MLRGAATSHSTIYLWDLRRDDELEGHQRQEQAAIPSHLNEQQRKTLVRITHAMV